MASITKTEYGWRAQVRKKGVNKSKSGFSTKREALAWASMIETEIDESLSRDIPDRPFADALRRDLEQVSIQHQGYELKSVELNAG